jgi:hypothetical protein
MVSETLAAKRVENGIKFLDRVMPPKWRQKINLDELSLSSTADCVLGQLYGDYDDGRYQLDLDGDEAEEYGFVLYGVEERDYWKLTQAWKLALSA